MKISNRNKAALIQKVQADLKRRYGKRKFYSEKEVKSSCEAQKVPMDWHCWAMCIYMDQTSFDDYHSKIGENCDYHEMRESVVEAIDSSDTPIPHLDIDMGDSSVWDFFTGFFDIDIDTHLHH